MAWRWVVVGAMAAMAGCDFTAKVADGPSCTDVRCSSGCCSSSGECVSGTVFFACGTNGAVCQTCNTGQQCINGACATPSTPTQPTSTCGTCGGCCEGTFCVAGSSDLSCGRGGEPCNQCPGVQSCISGRCEPCQASNCSGCCASNGVCLGGGSTTSCGRNGAACELCPGFTTCSQGVCR